jgi:hypothetical protein
MKKRTSAPASSAKSTKTAKTAKRAKPASRQVLPTSSRPRVTVVPPTDKRIAVEGRLQDEADLVRVTATELTQRVEALSRTATALRANVSAAAQIPTDVLHGYLRLAPEERRKIDDLIRTLDMRRVRPDAHALGVLANTKLTKSELERRERRATRTNATLYQQLLKSQQH